MKNEINKSWVNVRSARVADDGVITLKTSGWEGDIHWTGERAILPTNEQYELWNWIVVNRDICPSLIEESRVTKALAGLVGLGRVVSPGDGIFVLEDSHLAESLRQKLLWNVVNLHEGEADIWKVLWQLTGSNCFVFSGGQCEANLNISKVESEETITLEQAVAFIQEVLRSE